MDIPSSQALIVGILRDGLTRLTAQIPWLAGQVVHEDNLDRSTKTFKVKDFETVPHLVIRDLTDDDSMPSMMALIQADFPFSMLDEQDICPRSTMSHNAGESSSDPFPVLLVQVTFIKGGLLICVLASHITMDIVGQVQVIRLLSKACRKEPLTKEEILGATLDRRNIIPILDDGEEKGSIEQPQVESRVEAQLNADKRDESTTVPRLEWAYFKFPAAALVDLKAELTKSIPANSSFISTDDALCALIWFHVGCARRLRLPLTTPTTFVRQVDVRRLLGVPPTYLGNMVTQTSNTLSLEQLTSLSLSSIAAMLRTALDDTSLLHGLRENATIQMSASSRTASPPRDRSQSIVMSSWSKTDCYDADMGLGLGSPVSVRRPRFSPIEGVVYLLPKEPSGTISAGLCLRSSDMQYLKQEKMFAAYGEYIG